MEQGSRRILQKIARKHKQRKDFFPGKTYIPASGKVFDEDELVSGMEAVLDGWWTEGRFTIEFEKKFGMVTGSKYVTLTNSGSSANLLALTSLTSSVFKERALKPGDEVITVAAGFPTTVNPILQNRCIPVCVDVSLTTKNVNVALLKKAVTKKTKAILLAHTLGNPLPLKEIMEVVSHYHLWFIEDCCDALGASFDGRPVGTFGDVATYSFYPAHQITMGEGGAVVTNNPLLYRSIRQFRDWGRDCWCDTGKDNTCGKRFSWKLGDLPLGYDHKYIYSQVGYNLKLTDMQAAIGLSQLKKLPNFVARRRENFMKLKKVLQKYDAYFSFSGEEKKAHASWFGFMIVIAEGAPFDKVSLVTYLENNHVGTRSLFAGNLLKHPAYNGRNDIRVVGTLDNTNILMERGFWIGVWPGITERMIKYVGEVFQQFFTQY